ncbi:MAG TPA: hypothetical protein VF691_02010 [Cytophagaceae bacterium]|jgi:hypothetical protein
MKNYSFKNENVEIYLDEGVVFVVFAENARITAEKANIIVSERLKVCNGRSYPTLADCRKGSNMDQASRAIFASEDAVKNVVAGALLIDNAIQRMLINAYLWFGSPKVPNQVFTSERKALEWLQLFKYSLN